MLTQLTNFKTMKKALTLLSIALVALWACAGTNAGPVKKFTKFENAHITGLEIGSAFEVTIEQGAVAKAEFEVSADWADRLKVELDEEGTLDVSFADWGTWSKKPVLRLKVTCPTLQEIDASGAAVVAVKSAFSASRLKLDASGASQITFAQPISVSGPVKIDASGASVIKAVGSASMVDVEASGASVVDASKLTTPQTKCDVSGASSIDVFASDEATGEASGASSVRVWGGGAIHFHSVTGASSVNSK